MKRFGLNSGYIGVDRRRDEAGIAPLQKAYLERIRGENYQPLITLPIPPPLDVYSGAIGAFGMRLLDSNYTGDVLRVRRDSDNTELDIGFSNDSLDISSLISFCTGTDGYVVRWYDQSGNNFDLLASAATNQPKIYDNSTGIILENGLPAMEFDGSNDYLISTGISDLDFSSALSWFNIQRSLLSVVSTKGIISLQNILNSSGPRLIHQQNNLSVSHYINGGYRINETITTNTQLSTTIWDGSVWNTYRNGSPSGTYIGSFSTGGGTSLYLGNGFNGYWNGRFQEFLLYPSDETSNQVNIESNMNSYYNIY